MKVSSPFTGQYPFLPWNSSMVGSFSSSPSCPAPLSFVYPHSGSLSAVCCNFQICLRSVILILIWNLQEHVDPIGLEPVFFICIQPLQSLVRRLHRIRPRSPNSSSSRCATITPRGLRGKWKWLVDRPPSGVVLCIGHALSVAARVV